MLKWLAAEASTTVEPTATSRGFGKGKGKAGLTTTQAVVPSMAGPKGKRTTRPFSYWRNRPGPCQPPLDGDPIGCFEGDMEKEEGGLAAKTSRRQRRNIHGALVNLSFRVWMKSRAEAPGIRKTYITSSHAYLLSTPPLYTTPSGRDYEY